MNEIKPIITEIQKHSFRPQQGLTIMNCHNFNEALEENRIDGFRPQQGLTIMNVMHCWTRTKQQTIVSVPNRG